MVVLLQSLLQRLRGAESCDDGPGLDLLQEAMVLEAQNQAQGIKPLLVGHRGVHSGEPFPVDRWQLTSASTVSTVSSLAQVSNIFASYVQHLRDADQGKESEFVQAVDCIAALSSPELVSQTVLFL